MFKYSIFKENMSNEDGEYTSFGITIEDSNGDVIKSITDISTDEIVVRDLCERCNKGQLHPIHLYDVVEDFLN